MLFKQYSSILFSDFRLLRDRDLGKLVVARLLMLCDSAVIPL